MTATIPCLGRRVRRTAPHPTIAIGVTGTIDIVHANGRDFWVATDEGGFCGWTSYDQWMPLAEDGE